MSPLPPLSPEELLEQAPLDALGLLEEHEAALFERAFHAASPQVQHQVRALQARVAADPTLLSKEDPDTSLRARVLGSVLAEIDRSRAELTPMSFAQAAEAPHATRSRWAFLNSATLWQAASFALLAGLITTVVFYGKAVEEAAAMARNLAPIQISDKVRDRIGSAPWAVLGRAETKVALNSADRGAVGHVFVDETSRMVVIVAYGLPDTELPPILVASRPDGTEALTISLEHADVGMRAGFVKLDADSLAAIANCSFAVLGADGALLLS